MEFYFLAFQAWTAMEFCEELWKVTGKTKSPKTTYILYHDRKDLSEWILLNCE